MNDLNPPPVALTFDGLKAAVLPVMAGNRWAEDTIGDLWRMGAPMPPLVTDDGQTVERRLLVPSQFAIWLTDVSAKAGANPAPILNYLKGSR